MGAAAAGLPGTTAAVISASETACQNLLRMEYRQVAKLVGPGGGLLALLSLLGLLRLVRRGREPHQCKVAARRSRHFAHPPRAQRSPISRPLTRRRPAVRDATID